MRELVGYTLRWVGKRRLVLPIPFALARLQARVFELLPSPPLTTGQVDLLEVDNVASGALPGFSALGIQPRAVEDIVPTYVGTTRTQGPD
jgi:hypothetical protein